MSTMMDTCPQCGEVLGEYRCCDEHGYMNYCDHCEQLTPETPDECMHCGRRWCDEPDRVDDCDEDE